MHPHFQVLVTSQPYTHQLRLSQACRQHFSLHGSAYHEDLVETERALGERYVGRTGAWHWLAAYAPMGSNEIIAVHEHTGDFVQLSGEDLHALAAGLSGVLRLYEHLGYLSFNFTLYARRDSGVPDGFNCLMRCITRQNPYPNYRADDFFLQKGLETELIVELPEDLASAARNYVGVEMTKPGSSNV